MTVGLVDNGDGTLTGTVTDNGDGTVTDTVTVNSDGTLTGGGTEVVTSTTGRISVLYLGGDAAAPIPPSDVPIATDQTYGNRGYRYAGTGDVEYSPAVVADPANRTRQPVRRIHESLPAPTLVNGRPR